MLATFVVAVLAVPLTLMALAGDGEAEPVEAAGSPVGPTTAVEEKVVATTDGTEPVDVDAGGAVDNKAMATLSDGFARREAAAEEARAEAEAATNAAQEATAAAAATTVPTTAAPATTAPPTTTAPIAAAPVVTAPPPPPPPTLPPPPPVAAPPVTSAVWDQIAACESGGNWSINTGNGYYGGLQFLLSTWVNMGGRDFAEYPHQASRAGQIAVAERVVAAAGGSYGAWGGCAASLGLP